MPNCTYCTKTLNKNGNEKWKPVESPVATPSKSHFPGSHRCWHFPIIGVITGMPPGGTISGPASWWSEQEPEPLRNVICRVIIQKASTTSAKRSRGTGRSPWSRDPVGQSQIPDPRRFRAAAEKKIKMVIHSCNLTKFNWMPSHNNCPIHGQTKLRRTPSTGRSKDALENRKSDLRI